MAATKEDMKEQLIDSEQNKKPSNLDKFLSYAVPATGTGKGGFFTTVLGIVYHMRILFSVSKLHYFLLPIAPVLELLELVWDAIELKLAPKKTPEKITSVTFNAVKFLAVTAAVVVLLFFAVKLGAVAGLTGGIIFTAITGAGAIFNAIFAISKGIKAYRKNREAEVRLNASKSQGVSLEARNSLIKEANALKQEAQNLKTEVRYHIYGSVLMTVMTPLIALVFIKGFFGAAIAGSAVAGVGAIIGVGMFIYDKFIKKPTPDLSTSTSTLEMEKPDSDSENDLDPKHEHKLDKNLDAAPKAPTAGSPDSSTVSGPSTSAPTSGAPQATDSLPQQAKTSVAVDAVNENRVKVVDSIAVPVQVALPAKVVEPTEAPAKQYITPEFLSQVLKNIAGKPADSDKVYQNARQARLALNSKEAEQYRVSTPTISTK